MIKRIFAMLLCLLALAAGTAFADADTQNDFVSQMLGHVYENDIEAAFALTYGVDRNEFEVTFEDAVSRISDTTSKFIVRVRDMDTVVNGTYGKLAIYDLVTDKGNFEVHIAIDERKDKVGYFALYPAGDCILEEHEFTPWDKAEGKNRTGLHYYPLGTATETVASSAVLTVYSVIVLVFAIIMLIDCIRRPVKNKLVWVLVILLGSGYVYRLLIPVGAALYLCLRKRLVKKPETDI